MKRVKKFITMLLVGAFTFNEFAPLIEAAEMSPTSNEIQSTSSFEATGNIEVEMHFKLPIRNRNSADVTLKLFDSDNNSIDVSLSDVAKTADGLFAKTYTLGTNENVKISATKRRKDGKTEDILSGESSENIVYFAININNLKKGTYKLEFSGKNFVTYSTDVTLDNYSKRVNVTNEKDMFAIGDLNDDNTINDDDINIMLDAIKNKNLEYDLNLDGEINIADLNYVTANKNGEAKKVPGEKTSAILDSTNISFIIKDSVIEDGDLNNIFNDTENVVTLKQDGAEPIEVTLDLAGTDNKEEVKMSEVRVNFGSENVPKGAKLIIETSDGNTIEKPIIEGTSNEANPETGALPFTEEEVEGTKVIKLGGEVAVKKVTIVITETGSNKLADIAKVEFLNNVKVETKAPADLYKPKNVKVDNSVSEQLTVSFDNVPNVTGYEIKITGPKINSKFQTTFTSFTIEDLDNYKEYKIQVQSINGEWDSGWTDEIIAIPQAKNVPPAVDMVTATPTIGGIIFSWKDMMDTQSYKLYYRVRGTTDAWAVVEVNTFKYTLTGLASGIEYEAYVTGVNPNGEGSPSQTVIAKTLELKPTIYPKYNLINTYNGELKRTDHIKKVSYNMGNSYIKVGEELTDGDKWTMVDDNPESYWEVKDWQVNAHYKNMSAPIFILDQKYKMNEFIITVPDGFKSNYKSANENDALVYYWADEKDIKEANRITVPAKVEARKDENNRVYYVLKIDKPIETSAIQFGLTVSSSPIQIAELKFYNYDSLVDDVANLFVDELRVELKSDVTIKKIQELKERANQKNNGEYNPYRESVLNDLEYAEKLLNDKNLNKDIITLNPNISNSYNGHLEFAMTISDYQPLGIAVRSGEQINVYVGSTTGKVNAELVFTQNYAEANTWNAKYTLKLGQNIIDVPKIGSAEAERGGSVYVRYTSKPDVNNVIKIRVSGGTKIPVLDTSLLTTESAKKEAIKNYINDLSDYVGKLNNMYSEYYKDKENPLAYDKNTSALGVTEIVTKHGLWSFSAEAVEDAITTGLNSIDKQVERLYESTESFDEMMEMFYRHKGLKETTNDDEKMNAMPKARINIRYMRMFAGAFMYAGGYHIGIEYGSIAGVIQGSRDKGYFGWGISHEIGHQINQSDLVHAEVTNNVYALLAQTADDTSHSRLEDSKIYDKIYEKVTSHTLGKSQNVFVTLGMYWQLHLAYDKNKTFDDTDSIFSKINVLTRTYKNDNKYNKDELLILFASLAAKKNLTNYFEIWGIKPSEEKNSLLQEELQGLEKETKAIYYLNDAARRYALAKKEGISKSTKLTASITDTNQKEKRVTLNFSVSGENDKILGYEILRNGESIAFVSGDKNSYTDNVGTVNNRAFTYDVVAYDYLLNTIKLDKKLDEVKIAHDGSINKDTFTIESNFKNAKDTYDIEDADMDYTKLSVNNLIDGKLDTSFVGTERITNLNIEDKITSSTDNGNAYIIISLNTKMALSGIKYTALVEDGTLDSNSIKEYKIYVSSDISDEKNWIEVRSDTFNIDAKNPSEIVYFMKEGTTSKSQLWTYDDVSYIKIVAIGNTKGISGAEIDLIANPGDNVDFTFVNDKLNVGILDKDYCYLTTGCSSDSDEGKIKAGTVVFEGSYRGNPAFNIALLVDAKNNNIHYEGDFMAFAELEKDNSVFDVADGTWLFTMSQEEYNRMLKNSGEIRAILYRVNDAETNVGQRITSTSKAVKLPAKLGPITIED